MSTLTAAREWLAAADTTPDRARTWLESARLVLLPLGTRFEAVRGRGSWHVQLARSGTVPGPTILDPADSTVYWLVPRRTAASWSVPCTEALSVACWLACPSPDRTGPPGVHWLQPPDGSGALVDTGRLRAVLLEVAR